MTDCNADPAIVTSPREMAAFLAGAVAEGQARRFAIRMHETVCAKGDMDRMLFWEHVVILLPSAPPGVVTPARDLLWEAC